MSYIGTTEIGKIFLGDVEIDKAYLGNDLVFSSEPDIPVYTMTFNPSSYAGNWYNNLNNAYTDENSTTYAYVRLTADKDSYFIFDTSAIPADATIKSVTCVAKATATTPLTYIPAANRKIGLYSGTTLKGTEQTLDASARKFTFSGETWTRSEVLNARFRVRSTKPTSGSAGYLYVYGATLTVEYYML